MAASVGGRDVRCSGEVERRSAAPGRPTGHAPAGIRAGLPRARGGDGATGCGRGARVGPRPAPGIRRGRLDALQSGATEAGAQGRAGVRMQALAVAARLWTGGPASLVRLGLPAVRVHGTDHRVATAGAARECRSAAHGGSPSAPRPETEVRYVRVPLEHHYRCAPPQRLRPTSPPSARGKPVDSAGVDRRAPRGSRGSYGVDPVRLVR